MLQIIYTIIVHVFAIAMWFEFVTHYHDSKYSIWSVFLSTLLALWWDYVLVKNIRDTIRKEIRMRVKEELGLLQV